MNSTEFMAFDHGYIRLLSVAIGQCPDQAGGGYDHQNQREYQKPYQNCADHAGCGDASGDQDHREQDCSQYSCQRGIQRSACAIPWIRIPRKRCRNQQTQQIDDGDTECYCQQNRCDGDQSGDLQECGNDTDDSTGNHCQECTVTFAVT